MPRTYTLHDGNTISLGAEEIASTEVYFNPQLLSTLPPGVRSLPDEIGQSVGQCAKQLQKGVLPNIVIGGGASLSPGFCERLEAELAPRFETGSAQVVPLSAEKREIAAWTGGSILANLSTFESLWVTAAEYEEDPTAAMHRLGL